MFTNIIIAGVGSNLIVLKIIRFISRNNTSVQANTLISGNGTLAISNKEFYGLTTLGGLYLKGKLQMLTNFGYYGFRGWVMLAAIGICFKKMWGNSFTKLILTFVAIYYLLILDPFNIDRSQNAIVLSGSSDYSALVVFIGLILVGCFSMDIYDFLVRQFEKYKNAILIFFAAIFVALVTTREKVVSALTSRLNLFLSTSKEIGFYQHKVELFVASILILLVIIIILTTISYYKKTAIKVLISLVIFTILIPPFFLFDAGKVPLSKTFSYINESNQFKLEHSLILSDYFTAYYETKKILPPRSDIVTNSSNIMAYNNYFNMSMVNNFGKTSKVYGIGIICSKNNASIAVFNKIEVCELN
jgi:hypothetical protein